MIFAIARILRDRLIGFVSYTIGAILLVLMYVALLPAVEQSQKQMEELLKTMPESFLKAFGVTGIDLSSLEALLAMKQYNLVWPLMMIFFAVSFAASVIAAEAETGSIELSLSSPKSRFEIFTIKYLAGLLYVVLFTVLSVLSAIPIAMIFQFDYNAQSYFSLTYLSLAFGFAVYGIGFLFSALSSSRQKVYAASALLYVGMYVAHLLSTLIESLLNLQYLSFFYYYDYLNALTNARLDMLDLLVFVAIGVITAIGSFVVFSRRDF